MSQSVRDRLENFLYLSDFKWVEIDEDGGVGTQVHFGYDSKYGFRPRSPKNPLKFVGDVLEYEMSGVSPRVQNPRGSQNVAAYLNIWIIYDSLYFFRLEYKCRRER